MSVATCGLVGLFCDENALGVTRKGVIIGTLSWRFVSIHHNSFSP